MPTIPPFILKKLYARGSLRAETDGFAFALENTIAPGHIAAITGLDVDGRPVDLSRVTIALAGADPCPATDITPQSPLPLDIGTHAILHVAGETLEPGPHAFAIHVVIQEIGPLDIPISDTLD